MRVLDMAKQGLDAMIAEARDPVTGRPTAMGVALKGVKNAYVAELDGLDKTGVYKKAREAWAGKSASMDAVRDGNGVFTNSADENKAMVKNATASQREFMLVGMADKLVERLSAAGLNSDKSRALIRTPAMMEKMQPFFKTPEDFEKFVGAVMSEQQMAGSRNTILKGSQTAERLKEDSSPDSIAKMASIGLKLAQGRILGVIGEMWRMRQDVSKTPDPALDRHIAELLFSPDVAQTEIGQRLIKGPQAIPNPMAGEG